MLAETYINVQVLVFLDKRSFFFVKLNFESPIGFEDPVQFNVFHKLNLLRSFCWAS